MNQTASSLVTHAARSGYPTTSLVSRPATVVAAGEAIEIFMERRRKRHLGVSRRTPQRPGVLEMVSRIGAAATDIAAQFGVSRRAWRSLVVVFPVALAAAAAFPFLLREGPPCPVHPVTGQAIAGKVVPASAQIVLHPVAAELPDQVTPRATVREDGSFVVSTFRDGDGAPEGEYVATVQWFRIGRDGSPGGNVLPKKYSSSATSPLRVSIVKGTNQLPPFQLTR